MRFYLGFALLAIFNDSLDMKKNNMVSSNYAIVFLPQHVLVSLEPFGFVHIWVIQKGQLKFELKSTCFQHDKPPWSPAQGCRLGQMYPR